MTVCEIQLSLCVLVWNNVFISCIKFSNFSETKSRGGSTMKLRLPCLQQCQANQSLPHLQGARQVPINTNYASSQLDRHKQVSPHHTLRICIFGALVGYIYSKVRIVSAPLFRIKGLSMFLSRLNSQDTDRVN